MYLPRMYRFTALNFIAHANSDDGSCVFEECTGESDCPFDANGDGEIGSADLLEFLVAMVRHVLICNRKD